MTDKPNPTTPLTTSGWQRWRRPLRWLRVAFLSSILLVVCILLYMNRIGLPDFLKAPLLTELRSRGLDLQFTRMRLGWYRGIVAENVSLGRASSPFGAPLFIDEAELRLNRAALKGLRWQIDSLVVRRGRFSLSVPRQAGQSPESLSVDALMAELRFGPNDQWELASFQARCLGAQLHLTGTLTNASWIRHWHFPQTTNQIQPAESNTWPILLQTIRQIQFAQPPAIEIKLRGDARDLAQFKLDGALKVAQAKSSWGTVENLLLVAHSKGLPGTNLGILTELDIKADSLRIPLGDFKRLHLSGHLTNTALNPLPESMTWLAQIQPALTTWGQAKEMHLAARTFKATNAARLRTELRLRAQEVQSQWGSFTNGQLAATFTHALNPQAGAERQQTEDYGPANTDRESQIADHLAHLTPLAIPHPIPSRYRYLLPERTELQLDFCQAQTRWGGAQNLQLKSRLSLVGPTRPPVSDTNWAYWAWLEPFDCEWQCQIDNVQSPQLHLQHFILSGRWRAPDLSLTQVHADLDSGQLDAQAQINVASRELQSKGWFDFDVHQIGPLLPTNTQRWLHQYGWHKPPLVQARARLILPHWTNTHPSWRTEVLPTVRLDGFVQGGSSAFRNVPASSAQFHFTFSNAVWHIPDLVVERPEGRLDLAYTENALTRDYHWTVRSHIDIKALRPLLRAQQQRELDKLDFSEPPWIEGQVWGRVKVKEKLGFEAGVAATNFTFRGQGFNTLQAIVCFTNQLFSASNVHIQCGQESIKAPGVGFDLLTSKLLLTNVLAQIDPLAVTRVIGPKTTAALQPYQFARPPTVLTDGYVVVPGPRENDLRFEITGGPFHWSKFNLPEVKGTVLWRNRNLVITNFHGYFYQGQIIGALAADFGPANRTDLSFQVAVTNADFHLLLQDTSNKTNKLEGMLSGQLAITHANPADWQSWQGAGKAHLRQAIIWDIPLFGIFSPVLNAIVPGLGNSRANEGSATFTVRDSVIHTKDLEIHALPLRLHYSGTVDFQGRVNARVEASLLRGTPVVGPLFSVALFPLTKLFEYQVTGTLNAPKTTPVYILPKFLLAPLHPLRSLKELFLPEQAKPLLPLKP